MVDEVKLSERWCVFILAWKKSTTCILLWYNKTKYVYIIIVQQRRVNIYILLTFNNNLVLLY